MLIKNFIILEANFVMNFILNLNLSDNIEPLVAINHLPYKHNQFCCIITNNYFENMMKYFKKTVKNQNDLGSNVVVRRYWLRTCFSQSLRSWLNLNYFIDLLAFYQKYLYCILPKWSFHLSLFVSLFSFFSFSKLFLNFVCVHNVHIVVHTTRHKESKSCVKKRNN